MKKLKSLLLVLSVLLLLPFGVFASNEKINVYIFKGESCGYCAKALAFFESLDEEYKSYFNLVEKEVWYNKDNSNLMYKVAEYLDVEVKGVPFIVIGEKTFKGYDSAYDEDIKAAIKTAYENSDGSYKDVVAPLISNSTTASENSNDAAITIIILLVVVAGIAFLVYMAKEESVKETKTVVSKKNGTYKKKTSAEKKASNKAKK